MSRFSLARNRFRAGAALTTASVLATAGIALGTAPKKGWTYTTGAGAKVFVTFKVNKSGKKVIALSSGDAVKCSGGVGGFPTAKPKSAKIKKGKFKVVLKLYPLGGGNSDGTDTVTGKFLKGGKAKGTVKTHFTGQTAQSFCKGIKESWTATGVA